MVITFASTTLSASTTLPSPTTFLLSASASTSLSASARGYCTLGFGYTFGVIRWSLLSASARGQLCRLIRDFDYTLGYNNILIRWSPLSASAHGQHTLSFNTWLMHSQLIFYTLGVITFRLHSRRHHVVTTLGFTSRSSCGRHYRVQRAVSTLSASVFGYNLNVSISLGFEYILGVITWSPHSASARD